MNQILSLMLFYTNILGHNINGIMWRLHTTTVIFAYYSLQRFLKSRMYSDQRFLKSRMYSDIRRIYIWFFIGTWVSVSILHIFNLNLNLLHIFNLPAWAGMIFMIYNIYKTIKKGD